MGMERMTWHRCSVRALQLLAMGSNLNSAAAVFQPYFLD